MRAKDVMSSGVMSVMGDATVFDVAEILTSEHISALPIVDDQGLVIGIVSEADLIRRAEISTTPHKSWLHRLFADNATRAARYVRSHSRHVKDVMTKTVVTVGEDATLAEIAELIGPPSGEGPQSARADRPLGGERRERRGRGRRRA